MRDFIGWAVFACFLLGVLYIGILGSQKIHDAADICAETGGIQVRTYDGFACINKETCINKEKR